VYIDDEIWQNPSGWPRDTPEYVFLGRAVLEVGKVRFEDEWTGTEPTVRVIQPLPAHPDRLTHYPTRRHVHEFLMTNHPEFRRMPPSGMPPAPIEFSKEEWNVAFQHFEALSKSSRASSARFEAVIRAVTEALASGRLRSALRPIPGGAIGSPLPADFWQTESLEPRFRSLRLNQAKPFDSRTTPSHWIFLERKGLQRLVDDLASVGKGTAAHVTRCRKWLVEQMRASPDSKPQSKAKFFKEAKRVWGVTERSFDIAWSQAIEETGSAWGRPGAPRKLPRNPGG
jgi:hypothetical protein